MPLKLPLLVFALLGLPLFLFGQSVKAADIYPSNLDDRIYYTKYDDTSKVITGITFMVLAGGEDSRDRTPAFSIKLYLLVPGSDEPIFIKTYRTQGIAHMGSLEYKDETVDLSKVDNLASGTYRLGLFVDADREIAEPDEGNNAVLFQGEIVFTKGSPSQGGSTGLSPAQGPVNGEDADSGEEGGDSEGSSLDLGSWLNQLPSMPRP